MKRLVKTEADAPARAQEFTHDGAEFLVWSTPLEAPGQLTEAEQLIVAAIVAGRSNAEIAAARGTSARTVANQIAAIFRKLSVSSRSELAQRCAGGVVR